MIEEMIAAQADFSKASFVLNNFPDELRPEAATIAAEMTAAKKKMRFAVRKHVEPVTLADIKSMIAEEDLFAEPTIHIVYQCRFSISGQTAIPEIAPHVLILFAEEKKTPSHPRLSFITFDTRWKADDYIRKFFAAKAIRISDPQTVGNLAQYFDGYSHALEKTCENIHSYCISRKIDLLTDEIVREFLSLTDQIVVYTVSNTFFQRNTEKFFTMYTQFIKQENDFFSFFLPFLTDVKRLCVIQSLTENGSNDQAVLSFFTKNGIGYSPYRLPHDKTKIRTFGPNRLSRLLDFCLSVDFRARQFDRNAAQMLFDIGITEFLEPSVR